MMRFELVTAWSSRIRYHVKELSQSNNLNFLDEILGYDLYYYLTLCSQINTRSCLIIKAFCVVLP